MKNSLRRIALIADMHVGSKYALFPDEYEDREGNVYKGNRGQRQLYEYWQAFAKKCDELKVDTVFADGDILHGTNRKEFGRNLMFSDLEVQKDVAELLLRQIVKDRRFYTLTGSGYHESLDSRVHKELAHRLGGKFLGMMANSRLKPSKRIMNIAHGVGGAAIYTTQILNRESDFILQAEGLDQLPFHIDIMVRAHLHRFIHIHLEKLHLIQLPCWSMWEPNKIYVKYYGKKMPNIGGVILIIDDQDRIHVWHFTYPLPHIADYLREV